MSEANMEEDNLSTTYTSFGYSVDRVPCNELAVPNFICYKKALRAFSDAPSKEVLKICSFDKRKKVNCKSVILEMIEPQLDKMRTEALSKVVELLSDGKYVEAYETIIKYKK